LMGFPDEFIFVGSKTEIAKQLGNAVPPPLAGAIARMVRSALVPGTVAGRNIRVHESEAPIGEALSA